jgi:hypothetical protein
MAFEKLNGFEKKIADLPDVPSMSAADLKSYFDSAPEQLRTYLNRLITALEDAEEGTSGASSIGTSKITGLNSFNVQGILQELKTALDNKTELTGDHQGTWGGYSVANFPLGVTVDQMNMIKDTIYNGQSGERYPIGFTIMRVSGAEYAYPATYGSVVTMKYDNTRMTQFFFRPSGATEAYYRYWTIDAGYSAWFKFMTLDDVTSEIGKVVKGNKIQAGSLAAAIPAFSTKTQTIVFPEAFASGPTSIVGSVKNSSAPQNFPAPSFSDIAADQCTITMENKTASQVTVNYSWIAMQ